ncbi:MAG TPA: 30S ribosomal protein S12 methylthiotransferase RimO [Sedimentisphaerales bacterium]|jgi:ribosomal protein S12 methylthiotransferase|nr:30S ribosomal protein S12 methylthiotransferase RimO [Sedimentisphaerales bacterium]HNU29770.1 30S ribosomal protein S12 methylthiotransferase RimO [Sedimentisphaerales bacterium]
MTHRKTKRVTVGFVALGCPKNMVDSERMLAEIVQAEFLLAAEPEWADVVIVNTCGFIEPARAESLDAIRQAIANKKIGNVQKVIVTGCLSQRLGERLLGEAVGVDAVVGLEHRDAIVQVIRDTLASEKPLVRHGATPVTVADDRVRLRIGLPHSAYLRISEGCSHRCSFCTIPAIRGPFRSKPPRMVVDEARELVAAGAVELNLIGQDTTLYGRDLKLAGGLAAMLREIEPISGLSWIRLLYAYPTGIGEDLIRTMAESDKIVHYLDIPVQHASDRVLKAMRRPDTGDALRRLVEKLRTAMSDIVLRTTVIVGFPGETQRDFDELIDFIRWGRFDALGAFTYFPEAGTPAAEMPDQVPDEVKQARFDELMRTQQEIAFARNGARVGSRLTCLVDSCDARSGRGARRHARPAGQGRFYGQAPEIDSVCLIQGRSCTPGRFVDVKVVGSRDYDLLVEQV